MRHNTHTHTHTYKCVITHTINIVSKFAVSFFFPANKRCALLHKIATDAMGKVQYVLGGEEAGVRLRTSKSGERTAVSATVCVRVCVHVYERERGRER